MIERNRRGEPAGPETALHERHRGIFLDLDDVARRLLKLQQDSLQRDLVLRLSKSRNSAPKSCLKLRRTMRSLSLVPVSRQNRQMLVRTRERIDRSRSFDDRPAWAEDFSLASGSLPSEEASDSLVSSNAIRRLLLPTVARQNGRNAAVPEKWRPRARLGRGRPERNFPRISDVGFIGGSRSQDQQPTEMYNKAPVTFHIGETS